MASILSRPQCVNYWRPSTMTDALMCHHIKSLYELIQWPLGDAAITLEIIIFKLIIQDSRFVTHCEVTLFIRQQAITRANVDSDLCYHMTSQDHNCLILMHFIYYNHVDQLWLVTYSMLLQGRQVLRHQSIMVIYLKLVTIMYWTLVIKPRRKL